jgi:hypothetical protein
MVLHDACLEAARLGHQWVGPEHVTLAILDEQRPSIARGVLNDLGLTHHHLEESFLASLLNGTPAIRSTVADGEMTHPAPSFYEIQGWVAGCAAAMSTPPTTEIVLLALCWLQPHALGIGIDGREVVVALGARGVPVPQAQLPLDEPIPVTRRRIDVPFDKVADIRGRLLDAGVLVGFNTDAENGQAWVIVDDNDGAASRLIAQVVGRSR